MSRSHSSIGSWPTWFWLCLLAGLLVLLAHVRMYGFLTDDAFISFRYARNLAGGHGLVFNPGFERVEGFTNPLWVLILAALARTGLPPEAVANPLSVALTVALWSIVAWFAGRLVGDGRERWAALIAPFALALNRSFAVWSTSGLETRAFELLVVLGTLLWIRELQARDAGRAASPVAPWLFALACWTRLDGLVPALCALGVGVFWLARRRRLDPRRLALEWTPFGALVAGQFLLRRIYYGDWLPNTYYAKVGGALWWSAGAEYVTAFAIEYALWLWVPLAVLGSVALAGRGQGLVPLMFAAVAVAQTTYVAAVGGDFFEYRLLDLVFPFLFLLAGEGLRPMARSGARRWLVGAGTAVGFVLAFELPWQSHRQFPGGIAVGFPGQMLDQRLEAREYLDPARSPIYRWPGLSALAALHRDRLRWLTRHFLDIRQEEHARFSRSVIPEAHRLRALVDRGEVPRDLYVAMGAVGALPYHSDLRVLDMQGLTDARVARSGARGPVSERLMAHDRRLEWSDAVRRGVDLVAVDAHPLLEVTSDAMLSYVREAATYPESTWAADVGDGFYLVALLPQGPVATARRLPGLRFERLSDARFAESFIEKAIAAWRESLSTAPGNRRARLRLGWLLLAHRDYSQARAQYLAAVAAWPHEIEAWDGLAWSELRLGDTARAREALGRGIAAARAQSDVIHQRELQSRLDALRPAP